MGYRERRDPLEVAREIVLEAHAREAEAARVKADASANVATSEMMLEVGWAKLGAVTALERHLDALARAAGELPRALGPEQRAELERLDRERSAFLRERGVEPGPSLARAEHRAPEALSGQLADARRQAEEARDAIRQAEAELARARERFEAATEALSAATRARMASEAELRDLGARG